MAEKRRFIDVWLVETNTVYKEVPFAVVTDWVQQGRVLEALRLRAGVAARGEPRRIATRTARGRGTGLARTMEGGGHAAGKRHEDDPRRRGR